MATTLDRGDSPFVGAAVMLATMRVMLMITCLGDVLRPEAGRATVRLLRRLGHEVVFPPDQTCCGQPFYNSGYAELARRQARHTLGVFDQPLTVVTPSGSCAAMVKLEYPHLFADDPHWHARALELAQRTCELSEFLVRRLGIADVGASYHGSIAHHFACHLRGLGIHDEVETLIRNVAGATLVPLAHQDQCCGFGGSFAVRYPQISTALVTDKANCIGQSGANAVVSTDAGCLMNIEGRLRRLGRQVAVMHLAELLDRRETSARTAAAR